jgi:hypothetical protein
MNPNLTCPIRKAVVNALPEERIRVQLLCDLIDKLEYPIGTIAVEKELKQIPHLRSFVGKLPQRRADVLCFAKGIHATEELYPLLLFECISVKLTNKMVNQVVGYNHYLQAHFIALVNHEEIRTGWFDHDLGAYQFVPYLPTYTQLISFLAKGNHFTASAQNKN